MIRLLTPEDFALFKLLRLEALFSHAAAYGGSFEEESLQTDEEWGRLLRTSYVFAFMDEQVPVGMAGYYIPDRMKKRHRATVYTVYVKSHYRGRGVMDWLLGALSYHAKDMGVEQLHLEVGTYNVEALRCYERNGFAVYGTEPRALKLPEGYIDEYTMVKYL